MSVSAEQLAPGSTIVVHWEENRRNPQGVKSNKTGLGKTDQIILPVPGFQGRLPRPGEKWVCQVDKVTSRSAHHGAILVLPVQQQIEYKFPGVWIPPDQAQLIACVLQDPRRNLMLVGEQGVGKSTISGAISNALHWNFRKISGGLIKKAVFMLGRYVPYYDGKPVEVDAVNADILGMLKRYETATVDKSLGFASVDHDLIGILLRHLLKTGNVQSLTFKYAYSKLVESLIEADNKRNETFLIALDEFTRIDEDARDALLDVIEGKERRLRLVTGEEIPVGRNVKFMAMGNVGEGFTTKRHDAAQDDRWEIIKIGIMPQDEELAHCMRLYPSCPKAQMKIAIDAITKVRLARKDVDQQISKTVSTRRAEAVAMYLGAGIPLETALEAAVANQYEGAVDDVNSESHKVLSILKDGVAEHK